MQLFGEQNPELAAYRSDEYWEFEDDVQRVLEYENFDLAYGELCCRLAEINIAEGQYWLVEVFDFDDGGTNDTWVSELYDNAAEAKENYDSRIAEAEEAGPDYIQSMFGGDAAVEVVAYTVNGKWGAAIKRASGDLTEEQEFDTEAEADTYAGDLMERYGLI